LKLLNTSCDSNTKESVVRVSEVVNDRGRNWGRGVDDMINKADVVDAKLERGWCI
jgi:hypothetical protein